MYGRFRQVEEETEEEEEEMEEEETEGKENIRVQGDELRTFIFSLSPVSSLSCLPLHFSLL